MARVLVAEPNRPIRGILTESGHDVIISENEIEASVWLATSSIDVLVTDMVLHAEPGELLARSCAVLGIRTITLTGREFHADGAGAGRLSALLEKPFRFSDLHRVLNAVNTSHPPSTARRETSSAA
jgi:DNA-binding response OmpR family regulator